MSAAELKKDAIEPSLGPACGIIFVIGAILLSVSMVAAAYLINQNQPEQATAAIRTQLIPWIDESQLSPSDKSALVERLMDLSSDIEAGELDDRQFARLKVSLTQNPVLQWAVIDQTLAFATGNAEFTDAEREQLQRLSDTLLYACGQQKVSMEEFGFLVQDLATREPKSGRLELRNPITHKDVLSYMRRTEELLEQREVKFDAIAQSARYRSVPQTFSQMIDDALNLNLQLNAR